MDLSKGLLEAIVRHVLGSLPEECCGILIGSEVGPARARVHHALPAENASARSRESEYSVAPLAILRAEQEARRNGLEIVGYYHSHPSGSAVPSAGDSRDAWPDISYVILGVSGGELADVRSWRLGAEGVGFVEEQLNCDWGER